MADNLSVSVTADTSGLRAQLALAQADLKAFGAETRKLASDIRSGGDVSGQLRGQLEQVAGQFGAAKNNVIQLTSALRDNKGAATEHTTAVGAARQALAGFGEGAVLAREQVVGTFEKIQGAFLALTGLLAGGALFREVIQDVLQLDERVTSLQRTLGLSREEALQTDVALRLIGKSSDDYSRILLRLEQQVRTSEARMNALGVATRDASGEYLKLPEIFSNALAAIQTYKAGTDQAGVAQELFKRSAQEMFQYMDLTPAIMERAQQVIHDFGIELGDHESMIRYRVDLAALGMAGEAVGHQIADQLMPALSGLAAWFTGPGAAAVRGFGTMLKGMATEVIFLQSAWQELAIDAQTVWDQITEILSSAQQKAKAILTGAWGELERLSKEHENRMAGIAAAGAEEIVQIELRTARALEKIFAGELGEGGGSDITLPDVNVTGGGRRYTPPTKGGGRGRAGGAAKDEDFSGGFDQAQIFSQEEQAVSALRQIDDSYLAAFKSNMQALVAAHKITKEQQYGFEIQYTAQLHDQERQRLEAILADDNATTEQKTRVYLQLLELDARYTAQVEADQAKIAEAQQAASAKIPQNFTQMFDQIGSTLESTLAGMIERTTTWQQGLQKIFQQVLQGFIKMVSDMVSQWAASGLMSLGIGTSAGEGAGLGAVLGAGLKGLFGSLFGGLFGEGAPAAFSAPEAIDLGTLAFAKGGIVPSAQGGWAVPSMGPGGVLAQLHSNEMVLPAGLSNFVQNAAAQAGGGGNNFSIGINAVDSSSVAKLFLSNGSSLVAALNAALRNGAMLRTS
jgi:hypothetical protein